MSKKKWLLLIILIAIALYFLGPYVPYIGSYLGLFKTYLDSAMAWITTNVTAVFNANPTGTTFGAVGATASVIALFSRLYSGAKQEVSNLTQQVQQTKESASSVIGSQQATIEAKDIQIGSLETKLASALDGNKIITDLQTQNTQLQAKIQELQSDYNAVIRTAAVKVSIPTEPPRVP